ncbi:hypothetical protein GW17_00051605 [Ensete ventricosum]|nr:hypothetical protein GW17_00051605 [Ensete ventricosum]
MATCQPSNVAPSTTASKGDVSHPPPFGCKVLHPRPAVGPRSHGDLSLHSTPPLLVNELLVHPLAASMAMHPMAQPLATGHRDEVQVTAMALLLTMSPSPMAISFSFSLFKACMSQLGIKAELGMQMDEVPHEYTTVT